MRKLILAAVIGLFAISAQAQSTPPASSTTTTTPSQSMPAKTMAMPQSGVCMHNGKMMAIKDGKMMPMDKSMKMKNGTTVMADGSYTTKDGKKMMMKEGQAMDMNGMVMGSDMSMPPKK